ncbi:MAG: hypothetical protein HFJ45_02710 [Clostridia bacterium]|nr:hypothetical protein [Clostridia bacterium]
MEKIEELFIQRINESKIFTRKEIDNMLIDNKLFLKTYILGILDNKLYH